MVIFFNSFDILCLMADFAKANMRITLERLNKIRAQKGLVALKKGEKLPKQEAADFVEDESMNIMVDFMKQANGAKLNNDTNRQSVKK